MLSPFARAFLNASSVVVIACFVTTRAKAADEAWLLSPEKGGASRVEARIEVSGELKLLETIGTEDGGKSKQKSTALPLNVTAQLRYADRNLASDKGVLSRSIRLYDLAQAKMKVGQGEMTTTLAEDRGTIVVQESKAETNLYSPAGPLQREELELLSIPGDSGLLNLLLSDKKVKAGDTWEPLQDVLTRLLRLEIINQSDVKLTLTRVEKDVAILSIAGKVSGAVDGVTSELELNGKLNFDIAKQTCTWLALNLKEDRAPSSGTPGFKTTSQIRVAIAPSELPAELSDEGLAELKTTPDEATRLLQLKAKQSFELVYEPRWRVVSDQADLTVIRLIERGDLVAQGNASRLSPLGEGEQLTLEAFQANLKKSLGTTFGDFVEAGESLSDSGLRVLRVVISATVSEVPIHYVFYHLSDDHQNRLSLAFTMDADNVERFGRAEETLIGSLQFLDRAEEPAKPAAVSAKRKTVK
jgi:hypothetical protein